MPISDFLLDITLATAIAKTGILMEDVLTVKSKLWRWKRVQVLDYGVRISKELSTAISPSLDVMNL